MRPPPKSPGGCRERWECPVTGTLGRWEGPATPGRLRTCEWDASASTGQLLHVDLSRGWLGSHPKSSSVWGVRERTAAIPLTWSQEPNSVTFLCSDLQGLVFKLTRICLLETKAYVWALHVAHTNSQWGTYTIWFGSIESDLPTTISLLHVRFLFLSLHLFLGSLASPNHSLSFQAPS